MNKFSYEIFEGDLTDALSWSEHCKRAHRWARKYWILDGKQNYRKHFAGCMSRSLMLNYCERLVAA